MNKIPLTQGKFAIVDDEDYDHLMQWSWHINADGFGSLWRLFPLVKTELDI